MSEAVPTLPDTAPFSQSQRAWLNGFIAGLAQQGGAPGTLAGGNGADPAAAAAPDPLDDGDDGEAPWHDPNLPLDERLDLAAERPLRRKMMAAMGQLDCGQCGYDCETYANALFTGEEESPTLCVPGGKATQRMLKTLLAEKPDDIAAPAAGAGGEAAKAPGTARDRPAIARFIGAAPLNHPDSENDTRHIEIDLSGTGLTYTVGDSLGVYPQNARDLVDTVLDTIGVSGDIPVADANGGLKTIRETLIWNKSLALPPDELFELLAGLSGNAAERTLLEAMAKGEDPEGILDDLDMLELLTRYPHLKPDAQAFVAALEDLQPRLYSISSSQNLHPEQVHLTVATVRYAKNGRARNGVASTYFADRLEPGAPVAVYVQKANDFALPDDDTKPIIMIGPGTGVAPFRAFLQERLARKATGKAWIFYGYRSRAHDFLYEEDFNDFWTYGALTRQSAAYSRDSDEKVYVQDRLREKGHEIWRWIRDGAYIYVCGDASRMAGDVERVLHAIVQAQGGMSETEAAEFIAALKAEGRYQQDVY
jgi:sulfite reductase (NADPH) flavoprotein alpha-component